MIINYSRKDSYGLPRVVSYAHTLDPRTLNEEINSDHSHTVC